VRPSVALAGQDPSAKWGSLGSRPRCDEDSRDVREWMNLVRACGSRFARRGLDAGVAWLLVERGRDLDDERTYRADVRMRLIPVSSLRNDQSQVMTDSANAARTGRRLHGWGV